LLVYIQSDILTALAGNAHLLTEKLRETIATTVLGLTFATLGTIGTLSLTFLLTSGEQLDSDLRKEEYAIKELSARSARGNDFLQRTMDADAREMARVDHFTKLFGHKSNGEALRNFSEASLKEVTEDLAYLSGYSPESTGVGIKYHENVHAFFRTELAFWHWVGRNANEISRSGRLPHKAEEELKALLLERDFDVRALDSSLQDTKFDRDLRMQDMRKQLDETRSEVANWKWRFRLSGVGFFVTAWSFYFIFRYLIFERRDAKAATGN
jgi:hypothetical protein